MIGTLEEISKKQSRSNLLVLPSIEKICKKLCPMIFAVLLRHIGKLKEAKDYYINHLKNEEKKKKKLQNNNEMQIQRETDTEQGIGIIREIKPAMSLLNAWKQSEKLRHRLTDIHSQHGSNEVKKFAEKIEQRCELLLKIEPWQLNQTVPTRTAIPIADTFIDDLNQIQLTRAPSLVRQNTVFLKAQKLVSLLRNPRNAKQRFEKFLKTRNHNNILSGAGLSGVGGGGTGVGGVGAGGSYGGIPSLLNPDQFHMESIMEFLLSGNQNNTGTQQQQQQTGNNKNQNQNSNQKKYNVKDIIGCIQIQTERAICRWYCFSATLKMLRLLGDKPGSKLIKLQSLFHIASFQHNKTHRHFLNDVECAGTHLRENIRRQFFGIVKSVWQSEDEMRIQIDIENQKFKDLTNKGQKQQQQQTVQTQIQTQAQTETQGIAAQQQPKVGKKIRDTLNDDSMIGKDSKRHKKQQQTQKGGLFVKRKEDMDYGETISGLTMLSLSLDEIDFAHIYEKDLLTDIQRCFEKASGYRYVNQSLFLNNDDSNNNDNYSHYKKFGNMFDFNSKERLNTYHNKQISPLMYRCASLALRILLYESTNIISHGLSFMDDDMTTTNISGGAPSGMSGLNMGGGLNNLEVSQLSHIVVNDDSSVNNNNNSQKNKEKNNNVTVQSSMPKNNNNIVPIPPVLTRSSSSAHDMNALHGCKIQAKQFYRKLVVLYMDWFQEIMSKINIHAANYASIPVESVSLKRTLNAMFAEQNKCSDNDSSNDNHNDNDNDESDESEVFGKGDNSSSSNKIKESELTNLEGTSYQPAANMGIFGFHCYNNPGYMPAVSNGIFGCQIWKNVNYTRQWVEKIDVPRGIYAYGFSKMMDKFSNLIIEVIKAYEINSIEMLTLGLQGQAFAVQTVKNIFRALCGMVCFVLCFFFVFLFFLCVCLFFCVRYAVLCAVCRVMCVLGGVMARNKKRLKFV